MPNVTAPMPRASSTLRLRSRRCRARWRWARSTCAMKRRCSGLSPGSRTGSMRRANAASPPGSPGAAIFPTAASARRGNVTSGKGAGREGASNRKGAGNAGSLAQGRRRERGVERLAVRPSARRRRTLIGRPGPRDQEGAKVGPWWPRPGSGLTAEGPRLPGCASWAPGPSPPVVTKRWGAAKVNCRP